MLTQSNQSWRPRAGKVMVVTVGMVTEMAMVVSVVMAMVLV